jgi:hypothetical protein
MEEEEGGTQGKRRKGFLVEDQLGPAVPALGDELVAMDEAGVDCRSG